MGVFDNIKGWFSGNAKNEYIKSPNDLQEVVSTDSSKRSRSRNGRLSIQPQTLWRFKQDFNTWRQAIEQHDILSQRDRRLLIEMYADTVNDPHVFSCLRNRTSATVQKEWELVSYDSDGNPIADTDAMAILNTQWFEYIVKEIINSQYYGYSVIQLDGAVSATNTVDALIIPRQNVKPEWSLIVETPEQVEGVNFKDSEYEPFLIYAGDPNSIGLLYQVSLPQIMKKRSFASWDAYNELYGRPRVIGKTEVRDESVRNNMAEMLANFSSNVWGVFDNEDELEYLESSSGGGVASNYLDLIKFANEEISKAILGQTMTTENGSSRSQAEVHEKVQSHIIESDQKLVEQVVNNQLLPKLNDLGWNFGELTFRYVEADEHTMMEKAEIYNKLSEIAVRQGAELDLEELSKKFDVKFIDGIEKQALDLENKYNSGK